VEREVDAHTQPSAVLTLQIQFFRTEKVKMKQ
jgi:hypothetical protein